VSKLSVEFCHLVELGVRSLGITSGHERAMFGRDFTEGNMGTDGKFPNFLAVPDWRTASILWIVRIIL
jgi:hypothetical protein